MKSFFITVGQLVFSLFMYCMAVIFFGLALIPGITLSLKVWTVTQGMAAIQRIALLGFTLAAGYFLFGLTLVILVGAFRFVSGLRLEEGSYPIFSWGALKWAFLSGLYSLVNFTFIDFILVTPFSNILLRLLGAKLGKNVQINSKFVFDATLLEIGDNTVIGGGAIVIAHAVEHGKLKLKKVTIGKNVTVGSHSTVMAGCEIGDNAMIAASAVLLKNTKVEPRAVYVGVPAEAIRPNHHKQETNDGQDQAR